MSGNDDLSDVEWLLAAKQLGLKAKVVKQPILRLHLTTLPALVWCDDETHFILAKIDGSGSSAKYLIQDLEQNRPMVLEATEFTERYSGKLILIASRAYILGRLAKFDFTWFIPTVIKYRRIFLKCWLYRWDCKFLL